MSPSSPQWHVLLAGVLWLLAAFFLETGLVRLGMILGGLFLAAGAVVRLAGGALAVYEATSWMVYVSAVVILVGAVRRRRQDAAGATTEPGAP